MRTANQPGNGNTIKLRAHHLLCIYAFSGDGYDARFIANMRRIREAYASPMTMVRITGRGDDICSSCPFYNGDMCAKDDYAVRALDAAAQTALSVEPDHLYDAQVLRERVEESGRSGQLTGICSSCSWFPGHCRLIIDQRRVSGKDR